MECTRIQSYFKNSGLEEFLKIPAVRNNINARNLKGETAPFLAAKVFNWGIDTKWDSLKQLLKAGADPLIPDKMRCKCIRGYGKKCTMH